MKKNNRIEVNDNLVQKVFNHNFKDKNILFDSCLFYHDYDLVLIRAIHKDQTIKPKENNFLLFEYCKNSNIATYQIKFNDLINDYNFFKL